MTDYTNINTFKAPLVDLFEQQIETIEWGDFLQDQIDEMENEIMQEFPEQAEGFINEIRRSLGLEEEEWVPDEINEERVVTLSPVEVYDKFVSDCKEEEEKRRFPVKTEKKAQKAIVEEG